MLTNKLSLKILALIIIAYPLGWLFFHSLGMEEIAQYNINFAYYMSSLIGGIFGLMAVRKMGISNSVGKFIMFASIGLMSNVIGILIWDYYSWVLRTDPYPSIADIFYLLSTVFVAISMFFLIGAYKLRINKGFVFWGAILFLIYCVGYVAIIPGVFLTSEYSIGEVILNVAYMLNDAFTLSLAVVLLRIVGGRISASLSLFSIGVAFYAAGNVLFTIRDYNGTFFEGDVTDVLFTLGGALMSAGIITAVRSLYRSNNS